MNSLQTEMEVYAIKVKKSNSNSRRSTGIVKMLTERLQVNNNNMLKELKNKNR
jgi:hypothetical protein